MERNTVSLVPRPTQYLLFSWCWTMIQGSGRGGKAWEHSSCEWHQVEVGGVHQMYM